LPPPLFIRFITFILDPIPMVYSYEISYKIEGIRNGYNEILDSILRPNLFD